MQRLRKLVSVALHEAGIAAASCSRSTPSCCPATSTLMPGSARGFVKKSGELVFPKARFPTRQTPAQTSATPAQAAAAEAGAAAASTSATASMGEMQQQSAQAATAWMFPWERRQMEGRGPLRTWEKVYWGVFVTAMALFLFSRLTDKTPAAKKEVDEATEARKQQSARLVLAGRSFIEGEDPFEGLTPAQIEEYVQKATGGAKASDPFEGLSPDEIDEYIAKHGAPVEHHM